MIAGAFKNPLSFCPSSDLALLIVFAVAGYQGIAIPIVLLVLDALFIVGIVLTNFRFKYSVGIWTAYIVLSVVVTSISAVLSSGDVSMTGTATALNAVSHIALYIAAIAASLYPILKRKNKIKIAMISLTTVAVAAVGAFAVFFSVNGYFGQGFVGESSKNNSLYDSITLLSTPTLTDRFIS